MKDQIFQKIKSTAFFGTIYPDEVRRFDDKDYYSKENLFQYRLSKIKFFLGDKNGKEIILGLQTFYVNINGKEQANEEARDKTEKETDIKTFEIAQNDYICNFFLKKGDDRITQIRLVTKKGKDITVGSDEGEDTIVDFINDNKDHIILFFFGGYRKCLECIAAGYIPIKDYLGNTRGYFELKRKLKDQTFKDAIQSKLNKLSESDRILFRVCNLPDSCFNSIIKFCLY